MSQQTLTRGFSAVVDELRERYGWKLNEELGRGGFAIVYREEVDGIPRAVKISLDSLQDDNPSVQRQLEALKLLLSVGNHPQLLTLIRYELVLGHLVTVWELADQGTLSDLLQVYLQMDQPGLPVDELLSYMEQAAEGIDFLNSRGIYHRDIKPQNLFLVGGQVKVGDLGLLKLAGLSAASHTGAGTQGYLPPEAYGAEGQPGRLHHTIDVYGLAATYVHLRTGKAPFGTNPAEIYERQIRGNPITDGMSSQEAQWVCRALSSIPEQRPSSATEFVHGLTRRLAQATPIMVGAELPDLPRLDQVRLPQVDRRYVPAEDIPPLPRHLEELQRRFLAVEEAIHQVKRGTHPDLVAASQRLREAIAHAGQLRTHIEQLPLPEGVTPKIREVIWNRLLHNPDQPPSAFLSLLPGSSATWEFLQWLAEMKRAALASRPVAQAEQIWQATKNSLIGQLRLQQANLWEQLDLAQRNDLLCIIHQYRRRLGTKTQALPVELWVELGPKLQARYCGWDTDKLLHYAEWAWEEGVYPIMGKPTLYSFVALTILVAAVIGGAIFGLDSGSYAEVLGGAIFGGVWGLAASGLAIAFWSSRSVPPYRTKGSGPPVVLPADRRRPMN